uniref:Olfactory receptor n=1 Tax=Chelydra serpentina TaxID=8475 RepID=A0A8C3T7R9_CHESE
MCLYLRTSRVSFSPFYSKMLGEYRLYLRLLSLQRFFLPLRNTQAMEPMFILVGLSSFPEHQMFLFVVFTFIYMAALAGNLLIVLTITTSSRLHTPMYILLINLSLINLLSISTLVNLVSQSKSISFTNCLLQMYFVFSFGCTEYFLLAVMAYDRYLAICYPLHYNTIMSSTLCVQLALSSWVGGFLVISMPAALIARLSFCGPNVINHFFCDISPWIILSCTDTYLVEMVCFITFAIVILGSCVITLVSYIYIISTILKIPSAQGRQRAFSTCSSHLTVVIIWYGSTIFLHVKPSIETSLELTKIVTILNTIVTPLLNPFIYTLRNKLVRKILKKVFSGGT